jgi:hypothetical protein
LVVALTGFSAEFLPSHDHSLLVARFLRKELADPGFHLVRVAFLPYWFFTALIVLVGQGYAGTLFPGGNWVAMAVLLLAANYVWTRFVQRWRQAYLLGRVSRFAPLSPVKLRVDDAGLRFEDELSSYWFDWRGITRAVAVPEGAVVIIRLTGLLVPNEVFESDADRAEFIAYVAQRAGAVPTS